MIMDRELVKKIKDYFDLNIYETRVWLALLSKGVASAGEIAELSDVPRSRTYDVLESLEKKGFTLPKVGKPVKYIAVEPKLVLDKIKRNTLEEANNKINILDKLKETAEYKELESLHNSSTSIIKKEDISGALRGKKEIFQHVRRLLESATKEVLICTPARELLERHKLFDTFFENFKKTKISIRLALNGSDEELKKIQENYKIRPLKINLNSYFFIIDRKQIIFKLTNQEDEDEMAIWLNSEFFSEALAYLFENTLRK